jgi:hypothetical protein
MVRPALSYLGTVMIGVWVFYAGDELGRGGGTVRALLLANGALLPFALVMFLLAGVLMLPAFVLNIELVHRFEATTRLVRSAIGAASWAGWFLVIALTLAALSRLTLLPYLVAGDLALFLVMGAGFSLLAFDGYDARAGRALTVLALAVMGVVVLGSIFMSGRWGAAT